MESRRCLARRSCAAWTVRWRSRSKRWSRPTTGPVIGRGTRRPTHSAVRPVRTATRCSVDRRSRPFRRIRALPVRVGRRSEPPSSVTDVVSELRHVRAARARTRRTPSSTKRAVLGGCQPVGLARVVGDGLEPASTKPTLLHFLSLVLRRSLAGAARRRGPALGLTPARPRAADPRRRRGMAPTGPRPGSSSAALVGLSWLPQLFGSVRPPVGPHGAALRVRGPRSPPGSRFPEPASDRARWPGPGRHVLSDALAWPRDARLGRDPGFRRPRRAGGRPRPGWWRALRCPRRQPHPRGRLVERARTIDWWRSRALSATDAGLPRSGPVAAPGTSEPVVAGPSAILRLATSGAATAPASPSRQMRPRW